MLEQRNPSDHRGRGREITLLDLVREAGAQDRGRQREHAQPDHRAQPADDPAERRDRHDVAVAYRRERDDRPPHRGGDRAERCRLHFALDMVQRAGREQQGHTQDRAGRGEGAPLVDQHDLESGQGRRVPGDLEDPQDPQHAQDHEVAGHKDGQVGRQDGQKIDDRHGSCHVPQATPERLVVAPGTIVGRDPDPGRVLDGEHADADDLDHPQAEIPARPDAGHRVEYSGGDADQDQADQAALHPLGRPMRRFLVAEQLVDGVPPAM